MPKPTKGPRLGGSPSHERIILANLASQLFEHGSITTTEAKAKRVRPLAEKLITKAKRGDLHARRLVLQTVRDKGVVHTLFAEIAPKLADRDGGYTRITKIGPRQGDNAPMAVIEIVTESVDDSRKAKAKARGAAPARAAAKPAPRKAAEAAAPAPAASDDAQAEEAVVAEAAGEPVGEPVEGTPEQDAAGEGAQVEDAPKEAAVADPAAPVADTGADADGAEAPDDAKGSPAKDGDA